MLPGAVGEGFFVLDGDAALPVHGDAAPFTVVAEALVDPHPGDPDEPCEVCLGEAQGDAGGAVGQLLAILAGEGQDLGGDPAVDVEGGQRAGVSVGKAQPAGEHADEVAGYPRHWAYLG